MFCDLHRLKRPFGAELSLYIQQRLLTKIGLTNRRFGNCLPCLDRVEDLVLLLMLNKGIVLPSTAIGWTKNSV